MLGIRVFYPTTQKTKITTGCSLRTQQEVSENNDGSSDRKTDLQTGMDEAEINATIARSCLSTLLPR